MSQVLVLYDAVDTGSDAKLIVDLFKSFDYAWGIVAVFSLLFGLLNFAFGVGEWIPDSILKKCPFFKSRVIIKKNKVRGIFTMKKHIKFEDRVSNLFEYLLLFKIPEDLPFAVLRLFQHDMEKDIFYMIGNVSTTIGLSVTLITIGYALFSLRKQAFDDKANFLYFGGLTVAFLFILAVIILSCLAVRLHIVLSFGLRIMFDAVLSVLAIFAVCILYHFFTVYDEDLDVSKTCFNVLKEKLFCKRDVAPEDSELV